MLDRLDTAFNFTQKALSLRTYRQELIASNIANADTPHYKARDIDFKSTLDKALAGRMDGALGLARTAGRHLAGVEASPYAGALKYRSEYQSAVDGNTVNMDVERSALAENSVHIEALLTALRIDLKDLQTAITSQ